MKFVTRIVLFLFLAFLSAPTLIALIAKDTDTSLCYSLNEEELQKDMKEIKADLIQEFAFNFNYVPLIEKTKIISENLSKHDNVASVIFSPPPELV
jgi:hypothetical protein